MNIKPSMKFCRHLGHRALFLTRKNAPKICLAIGGLAGIGCLVSTYKAAPKIEKIIEHHNTVLQETKDIIKNEPERFTEKQQRRMIRDVYIHTGVRIGKVVAKPTIYGLVCAGSIFGGYKILNDRNVALTGALAYAERKIQAYENERARLLEANPDALKDIPAEDPVNNVLNDRPIPNDRFEFFWGVGDRDYMDPRENGPLANVHLVRQKEEYANTLLPIYGAMTVNDVLHIFDKQVTKEGQFAGWVFDPKKGDHQIDLGLNLPENIPFIRGEETDGVWLKPNCENYILDKMISAKSEMWEFYRRPKKKQEPIGIHNVVRKELVM